MSREIYDEAMDRRRKIWSEMDTGKVRERVKTSLKRAHDEITNGSYVMALGDLDSVQAGVVWGGLEPDESRKYDDDFRKEAQRALEKMGRDKKVAPWMLEGAQRLSRGYSQHGEITHAFLTIISIAGFALGLFFLSSNLTGNVIRNISNLTLNIIGATLFVGGLVATFFLVKK